MQEETRTLPLGLGQREEAQPRWKDARKQHRSVERDVRNRLHSILSDIRFTHQLHSLHFSHLPLIPNLRCGACLKRPNLAFLKLTLEKRGAVCVDSTRRGKILPDALSKTLPIWCAVLNEASFRRHGVPRKETQPQTVSHHSEEQRAAERHPLASLRTYLSAVSPQEHADIECRLHDWAEKLLSSAIHVARLEAPLVPFFITPSALGASLGEAAQEGVETDESASLTSELEAFRRATKDHNIVPVICVSASLHANAPGQEAHLPRTRKRKNSNRDAYSSSGGDTFVGIQHSDGVCRIRSIADFHIRTRKRRRRRILVFGSQPLRLLERPRENLGGGG
ncbi:Initiator tRNA phosphoribosyl-transferase [Ceraceosorus bombacis]|uniref:Initiator tRNA phosphoribosyl-transferase n=1 Tax=Ceraceosorus bombacis TaxID=401625 RepID=A0A0P1BAW0_9BASI|nr:Initiator tRNA phosphoribosyl-transferase [Ceraceosorus bombacis]